MNGYQPSSYQARSMAPADERQPHQSLPPLSHLGNFPGQAESSPSSSHLPPISSNANPAGGYSGNGAGSNGNTSNSGSSSGQGPNNPNPNGNGHYNHGPSHLSRPPVTAASQMPNIHQPTAFGVPDSKTANLSQIAPQPQQMQPQPQQQQQPQQQPLASAPHPSAYPPNAYPPYSVGPPPSAYHATAAAAAAGGPAQPGAAPPAAGQQYYVNGGAQQQQQQGPQQQPQSQHPQQQQPQPQPQPQQQPPQTMYGDANHAPANSLLPPFNPQGMAAASANGTAARPKGDRPIPVVGSQGRRGILPSAPGRVSAVQESPAAAKNAVNSAHRRADGKYECQYCNKSYLHLKHLKRHHLRHTGERPYQCYLCQETFCRSDILKRHFQKCSIRRGNPTGATHLTHAQAHLRRNSPNTAAPPPTQMAPNPAAGPAVGGAAGPPPPPQSYRPGWPGTADANGASNRSSRANSIAQRPGSSSEDRKNFAVVGGPTAPPGNAGGLDASGNGVHEDRKYPPPAQAQQPPQPGFAYSRELPPAPQAYHDNGHPSQQPQPPQQAPQPYPGYYPNGSAVVPGPQPYPPGPPNSQSDSYPPFYAGQAPNGYRPYPGPGEQQQVHHYGEQPNGYNLLNYFQPGGHDPVIGGYQHQG